MKGKLWNKLGEGFIKLGMKMKHYSPELLIGAGIVGGVVTVVMACKATMDDAYPILQKTKEGVDKIHKAQEKGLVAVQDENGVKSETAYTENDAKKDLTKVYIHTGFDFVKLYLPAASIGILSVVSILSGTNIMRKRNVALAAAYATIDNSFKQYRDRVAQKYGEEAEKELRYNLKAEQITEKITDENGKEKKVKSTIQVAGDELSGYARYYDHETSEHWEPSHDYNLMYLRGQQNVANDLLRVRRMLYLNDIFEMIGMKKSIAGQSVGWIYNPELGKDNYIDFGIREVHRRRNGDFVCDADSDLERTIILDFNVDGPITENAKKLDLIEA